MNPPLLAVDTNFLMDIARPREMTLDAHEVIQRRARGAQVVATLTVLDELDHKAHNDPDGETRAHARTAMTNMRAWGVLPVELTDSQERIADSIADKLRRQGIILRKERNDAHILAEAAVLGCQLLLTSDNDFRIADPARLRILLGEFGLATVPIRTPGEIVREFGGR